MEYNIDCPESEMAFRYSNNRVPGSLGCLQYPTLELHSGVAPSVEAHHRVNGPKTGKNSGGRWIKKIVKFMW